MTRRRSLRCSTAPTSSPAQFAERYEGKVAELDGAGLRGAMEELAAISELAGRAANFAHLRFAADTEDPANGALMQLVSERATAIQTKLLFFELEWVEVDDERAEELLATEGLEFCRHYLRMERRYRPHLLTQARGDDRRPSSRSPAAAPGAGCSTSSPRRSGSSSPGAEEPVSLDVALSGLFNPDRDAARGRPPRR